MRYVIFGAGAVGGTIGARLHESGRDAILIARGAHHDAIAAHGLRLRTPDEDRTLRVPVARDPRAAQLTGDDVILLCVKSQDTRTALQAIAEALPPPRDRLTPRTTVPIVCVQNGVENEREALRAFPDVYGVTVMLPSEHLEPGVVICYGATVGGRLDIGRYPTGVDILAQRISDDLRASRFESDPRAEIMLHKYAKLVSNLTNAIDAICGRADLDRFRALQRRAHHEGDAVLEAAGIAHRVDDVRDVVARWERFGVGEVDGHAYRGSSTWQSVTRGTGSIESEFLTGEIVLIARRHGIAAPVNELLLALVKETVAGGHEPGWITPTEILARLEQTGH